MNERDRQFTDAAQAIEQSLVLRTVGLCTRAIDTGIRESTIVRALARARLTPAGWIIVAAVGVATHVLLLQVVAPRIAPVKPLAYAMVVAFAVFTAVAGLITTRSDSTATADSSAGTANATKS